MLKHWPHGHVWRIGCQSNSCLGCRVCQEHRVDQGRWFLAFRGVLMKRLQEVGNIREETIIKFSTPKNSCMALSEMGWGQSATACTLEDNRTTPSDRVRPKKLITSSPNWHSCVVMLVKQRKSLHAHQVPSTLGTIWTHWSAQVFRQTPVMTSS